MVKLDCHILHSVLLGTQIATVDLCRGVLSFLSFLHLGTFCYSYLQQIHVSAPTRNNLYYLFELVGGSSFNYGVPTSWTLLSKMK